MMSHDWQAARNARALDLTSAPPGNSVIQYAAHGLLLARARAVIGISWAQDQDGRIPVPKEFWAAILSLTGSEYRDWEKGNFRFKKAARARYYSRTVEVLGVEFDVNKCSELFGSPHPSSGFPQTSNSAVQDIGSLASTVDLAGERAKTNGGGRSAGKAGYAHAQFIITLQSMDHLADEKVDSLAALLAAEYEKIGLKPPAPENLKVWVASMRRALLGGPAI